MWPGSCRRWMSSTAWQAAATRPRAGGSLWSTCGGGPGPGTRTTGGSPQKARSCSSAAGEVTTTTFSSGRWRRTSFSSPSSTSVGTVRSCASSSTTTPYCRSSGSDVISRSSISSEQYLWVCPERCSCACPEHDLRAPAPSGHGCRALPPWTPPGSTSPTQRQP